MCSELKMVERIAKDMFPKDIVNVAPLFKHEKECFVLLNGLQKFDPIQNRRHAWDIMTFYNLYAKKLPNDYWQAGRHDLSDGMMKIKKSPNKALVAAAYSIIKGN